MPGMRELQLCVPGQTAFDSIHSGHAPEPFNQREVTLPFSAIAQQLVKLQRRTRGTFMRAFSNESFSHYQCVEAALPFSAVAQQL